MSETTFLRLSTKWENDLEEANEQLAEVERLLAVGDEQDRRVARVMQALDSFGDTWEQMDAVHIRNLLLTMVEQMSLTPEGDGAVMLRLKCYYMPEVDYPIPHLRERLGEGDGPLAELTLTDLAFLALWNEGLTAPEIAKARGLVNSNSGYGQISVIRRRTGIEDMDEVATMARPLIEKYRAALPTDRKSSDKACEKKLEPTEGQLRVARLCLELDTYQQVADALDRSLGLVSSQMRKLRDRLNVATNEEAFLLLGQQGKLQSQEA
jgi:DNA-binding CsgD family transcriptional regulator